MTDKKFNILLAEGVDAIRGLAQSTIRKHCTDTDLVVVANRKELKVKLETFSPDLIIISENIDLRSKKLLKWLNAHSVLRERFYVKAKTDRFERLIPPDHLLSSLSLSGINFWALVATQEGDKRRLERYAVHEVVSILSGQKRLHGSLVNIAEGGVLGLFPRDGSCPPIAEKVLFDLGPEGKPILAGVSGFSVRIQTERPEFKCSTIQIAVKFNNVTEEHTSRLKKYIDVQKKNTGKNTKKVD